MKYTGEVTTTLDDGTIFPDTLPLPAPPPSSSSPVWTIFSIENKSVHMNYAEKFLRYLPTLKMNAQRLLFSELPV